MTDDIKPVAWAIFRDGALDWEHDQPFSDEPQSMMDDEESRPLYGGEVIAEIERLRADKRELTAQLRYIRTHLYAATVQRSPADDRIIADHIEQAYLRANEVIAEMEKAND